MGDGVDIRGIYPIPTPALPLKGREKCSGALKLAHMRLRGNDDRCRVSVMNYVMIKRMLCVANAEGGLVFGW